MTKTNVASPSVSQGRSRTPKREPAPETRAYFRCDRLAATLSVEQCRTNRGRMTPQEMMALPYEVPTWWVQPLPCWSCALARVVEAGSLAFYSAEQVFAGQVPGQSEPAWEHAPARLVPPALTLSGSSAPGGPGFGSC